MIKSQRLWRRSGLFVTGLIILTLNLLLLTTSIAYAQSPVTWSSPVALSDPETSDWFADIAVDHYGTPHVIWDGGLALSDKFAPKKKLLTLLMHTQLEGDAWSEPLDVVAAMQGDFILENMPQAALTTNPEGDQLWLWYEGSLYQAPVEQAARSAANWASPIGVSREVVYTGNAVVDKNGFLHAVYDEPTLLENPYGRGINKITHLTDIYYRRSIDGGRTWSSPFNLSRTEVGETSARLTSDAQGVLYVSWDEGWDRKTDEGKPKRSVLTISYDGGHTWSPNITFSYPEFSNAQLAVAGDGREGVLAIWRATTGKEIYYSWSTDRGVSWSEPEPIPDIYARVMDDTPFDSYDMVVDSAGNIHLAAVGRLRPEAMASQLYHLVWSGKRWSAPTVIFPSVGWPESPRLAISQGNRLHLVWFVRDSLDLAFHSRYQVWYSQATVAAPAEALPSAPTATPMPHPSPSPTVDLTPTVPKSAISDHELNALQGIRAGAFFSDDDLPMLVVKSIAPLMVVVAGLFVGRQLRLRK